MPSQHDREVHAGATPPIGQDDTEQLKALLTFAADGLAAEVLDGTEQERAAVLLGRLLGRERTTLVLTCRGEQRRYRWPEQWERAVTDHGRATSNGATVEARRDDTSADGAQ